MVLAQHAAQKKNRAAVQLVLPDWHAGLVFAQHAVRSDNPVVLITTAWEAWIKKEQELLCIAGMGLVWSVVLQIRVSCLLRAAWLHTATPMVQQLLAILRSHLR